MRHAERLYLETRGVPHDEGRLHVPRGVVCFLARRSGGIVDILVAFAEFGATTSRQAPPAIGTVVRPRMAKCCGIRQSILRQAFSSEHSPFEFRLSARATLRGSMPPPRWVVARPSLVSQLDADYSSMDRSGKLSFEALAANCLCARAFYGSTRWFGEGLLGFPMSDISVWEMMVSSWRRCRRQPLLM